MLPDTTYPGGLTWEGTGLSFSADPGVIKGAIALLKQRNPATKVLIAVGGATYPNWGQLDVAAITRFVEDWGLDGVDIDFEAEAGCSKGTDGKVKCHSDADYISAIQLLRAALPRPYILTTAAWSIGAYGEG
jgi:chitinase